jgi:sec-independent protein translocase protein TatB
MNFLGMGPMELMMILVLALIVFGPGKLPEIAGQVGKVIRDFRRTTSELSSEFSRTLSLEIEERKATQTPQQPAAEAPYEPPPAETIVGTVDPAAASAPAAEPTEAPPVAVAETSPSLAPEPVAAASPNGVSKRRTRDTGIEPPY